MESLKLFEKYFKNGMIKKDFKSFQKTYPTLLNCIVDSINEIKINNEKIKDIAQEYGEFLVRCDRVDKSLISFEDYLKQYHSKHSSQKEKKI